MHTISYPPANATIWDILNPDSEKKKDKKISTNHVHLYTDGACEENGWGSGKASCGFVLSKDKQQEKIIYKGFAYLGKKLTCNVAEWQGLIIGLKKCASLGYKEIYVFMDSDLVAKQATGKWKIKKPHLFNLFLEYQKLVIKNDLTIHITWIPREENMLADKLSKKGLETKTSYHR